MSTRDTFYSVGCTVFCDRLGMVKHYPMPYAPKAEGGCDWRTAIRKAKALARSLNGTGPRAERARQEAGL